VNEVDVTVDVTVEVAGVPAMTLVIWSIISCIHGHSYAEEEHAVCGARVVVTMLVVVGVEMLRQEQGEVKDGPINCVKHVGVPIGGGV
jgi:hypothetical protein